MLEQYIPVLIAFAVAMTTAGGLLAISAIFGARSRRNHPSKREIFETGMVVSDPAHKRISIKFYYVAIIFLILDVEVAFLFPWALKYKEMLAEMGPVVLWDMIVFMSLLVAAYAYLWKKGVFDWAAKAPVLGADKEGSS